MLTQGQKDALIEEFYNLKEKLRLIKTAKEQTIQDKSILIKRQQEGNSK